ncbi:MAG TPA: hypothetical protein DEB24_06460 [Coriobacteriia bacterium]|nr:hypothetical protein [Coriobacteriia bacterium]
MSEQSKGFRLSASVAYAIVLLVLLVLLFGAAIAVGYQVVYSDNQLRHLPEMTMVRGDKTEKVELPATIHDVREGERIILTGSYQTKTHDSMLVEVGGAKLVLFVDDNEAYSIMGEANTYPAFQKSPATDVMLVTLPNINGAKTFRFEYTIPEAQDSFTLPVVYIGENTVLFEYLASEYALMFIFSGVLIAAGVLLIFFTLLVMRRIAQANSIIYLGIVCVLAGLTGLEGNGLAIYLLTLPNFLYALSMVGILLFAVPLLQYAKLSLDPKHKRPLVAIQVISGLFTLTLLSLHLTGLVSFAQSRFAVHAVILFATATFVFYTLFEFLAFRNVQAQLHIVPACVLFLFVALDIINGFFSKMVAENLFFQVGVLAFMAWTTIIGWGYMRRLLDEAERSRQLELEVTTMNRSLDMQRTLYQNLSHSTDEVRRVRHDLRHQLSAIRGYLKKGNIDGALGYVETISGAIPEISDKLLCDNFAVNAVAVHYLDKAIENKIDTDLKLVVPEDLGRISDHDMSIIVGNLFENAIEACLHVPEGKRFIRMSCKVIKNRLTLAIDNSFDGSYSEKDGAFYSRKREGKGVGVSSVQAVVERYDGSMKIEAADGVFMVSLYVKM